LATLLKTLLAPLTREKERHERRNKEGEELKGHNIGRHDNELWSLLMLLMGGKKERIKNKKHKQEGK
jgi:hypothetical protein